MIQSCMTDNYLFKILFVQKVMTEIRPGLKWKATEKIMVGQL